MSNLDENVPPAYTAMADAVRASVDELLIPFHIASKGALPNVSTKQFFQKFLVYADKFTGKCCQDFTKILRQASIMPDVRGTPTLQLAKEIREVAFEMLDKILVSYVQALQKINLDLREAATGLSQSSMLGEAVKGAAIGQVAGGLGDGGKVLGALAPWLPQGEKQPNS